MMKCSFVHHTRDSISKDGVENCLIVFLWGRAEYIIDLNISFLVNNVLIQLLSSSLLFLIAWVQFCASIFCLHFHETWLGPFWNWCDYLLDFWVLCCIFVCLRRCWMAESISTYWHMLLMIIMVQVRRSSPCSFWSLRFHFIRIMESCHHCNDFSPWGTLTSEFVDVLIIQKFGWSFLKKQKGKVN